MADSPGGVVSTRWVPVWVGLFLSVPLVGARPSGVTSTRADMTPAVLDLTAGPYPWCSWLTGARAGRAVTRRWHLNHQMTPLPEADPSRTLRTGVTHPATSWSEICAVPRLPACAREIRPELQRSLNGERSRRRTGPLVHLLVGTPQRWGAHRGGPVYRVDRPRPRWGRGCARGVTL